MRLRDVPPPLTTKEILQRQTGKLECTYRCTCNFEHSKWLNKPISTRKSWKLSTYTLTLVFLNCSFARDLALITDGEEWQCSNGFLHRFCQHCLSSPKSLLAKTWDCPDYTDFLETTLWPLLQEYEPNDIYNADDTSLFYKALGNRMYASIAETVRGLKYLNSKDRPCTNMTDTDKLPPLIIGKAA